MFFKKSKKEIIIDYIQISIGSVLIILIIGFIIYIFGLLILYMYNNLFGQIYYINYNIQNIISTSLLVILLKNIF